MRFTISSTSSTRADACGEVDLLAFLLAFLLVTHGEGEVLDVVVEVVALALGQAAVAEQLPEIGELGRLERLAIGVERVEPLDLIEQHDLGLFVVDVVAVEHLAHRAQPRRRVAIRQLDLTEPVLIVECLDKFADEVGLADPSHPPQVDDHRAGQHLGHQVPDPDTADQLVDDRVDPYEERLELDRSRLKSFIASADRIAVDSYGHWYLCFVALASASNLAGRNFALLDCLPQPRPRVELTRLLLGANHTTKSQHSHQD